MNRTRAVDVLSIGRSPVSAWLLAEEKNTYDSYPRVARIMAISRPFRVGRCPRG